MKIAIIGGGAAGFFLAVHVKQAAPQSQVVILEKGQRVLAKVSISGGGRCNLTNSFKAISDSGQAYPRGARLMKRLLHEFSAADTYRWFEANGVPLVTQEDECVFPVAQNSAVIINCLTQLAGKLGVEVRLRTSVAAVVRNAAGGLEVLTGSAGNTSECFDKVAVTTGGAPAEKDTPGSPR